MTDSASVMETSAYSTMTPHIQTVTISSEGLTNSQTRWWRGEGRGEHVSPTPGPLGLCLATGGGVVRGGMKNVKTEQN
ncbi:hypothetical protein ACOMHN_062977 [Nucella lapillus]